MGNTKKSSNRDQHHQQIEICFTGFKQDDKKRLMALARQHDMLVRKTVTINLDFLCCGYNKGPAKIKKAQERGAILLTEETLFILLKTGEIVNK